MRTSKSRSRNKNNRNTNNRSGVNIVNRVFDSSGPEGKVRGTPQQIIEKYNQLARDAQLGNDRVAAENFQQHAEHYLRMLSEAQREIDARRDQDVAQQAQRDRQQGGGQGSFQNAGQNGNGQNGNGNGNGQNTGQNGNGQQSGHGQPAAQQGGQPQPEPRDQGTASGPAEQPRAAAADGEQPGRNRRPRTPRGEGQPPREAAPALPDDVIDTRTGAEGDSGLVETPESKPSKPRRTRSKPRPRPEGPSEAAE